MNDPVTLPRWLVALLLALSAWALIALLLLPGLRWWFRSRANRVIDAAGTPARRPCSVVSGSSR